MIEIDFSQVPDEFAFHRINKEFEKKLYNHYFKKCRGNQSKMAEVMGIDRRTIRAKPSQYGIYG